MKPTLKQFKQAASNLSQQGLSSARKAEMLASIYSSTEPVAAKPTLSPWSSLTYFHYRGAALIAGLCLILTGGTAFAAAKSLPGEPLYAIKTEVIEPVALSLKLSEKARNDYKVSLLQERVKELQILESEGKATPTAVILNFTAATRLVRDLEGSAIFDENGKNSAVSGEVNNYNSAAASFDLQIESNILDVGTTSASASTSIKLDVPTLDETMEDVKDTAKQVPGEAIEEVLDIAGEVVNDVVTPALPPSVSAPIQESVKSLGL